MQPGADQDRLSNSRHRPLYAILRVGTVLAPGAFVFQILQAWVAASSQPSKETMLWVVPSLGATAASVSVAFVLSLTALLRQRRTLPSEESAALDPVQAFLDTSLEYIRALAEKQQDQAILEAYENIRWILHAESANEERIELGHVALHAAIRENDIAAQVSVLIDELGWANHMIGQDDEAIRHLQRAIEVIDSLPKPVEQRFAILRSKANRHLGLVVATRDPAASESYFKSASNDLTTAELAPAAADIELGQLLHAVALAAYMQISPGLRDGQISPTDQVARERAESALAWSRQASGIFEKPGNWQKARLTKAAFLEHQLLVALGRLEEAEEMQIRLDHLLKESAWGQRGIIDNVRGIK